MEIKLLSRISKKLFVSFLPVEIYLVKTQKRLTQYSLKDVDVVTKKFSRIISFRRKNISQVFSKLNRDTLLNVKKSPRRHKSLLEGGETKVIKEFYTRMKA